MSTAQRTRTRRTYDNTLRRQRAAETHDRILDAGVELLAGASLRDWRALTVRAVADQAEVSERTVYRHFTNERGLRDAVMRRVGEQAGIDLDRLELDGITDVTRRIVATIASHPLDRRPPADPTLHDASRAERAALLRALEPHTESWSIAEQAVAAAMFNALWRVSVYEHLAVDWELDEAQATAGIAWVVGLLEEAVRAGRRPGVPAG